MAGINVELEDYNHSTRTHWKIVSDGSIRGNNPFELVSPILQGNEGLEQLRKVSEVLESLKTKINKTCGLHIHFDAVDFDISTWKRLYKNYASIEDIIDSFMPESRRKNNSSFCRSMRVDNFKSLIDAVSSTSDARLGLAALEWDITYNSRYYKLNTQSYWRHKSVEFRQHSGTVNYEKISNWILFLARFIEFSKRNEINNENWDALKGFLPDELINFYEERKMNFQ